MNYNILVLIIYSVIFILIVHLLIKHILLREKIFKKINLKNNNVSIITNELPKIDIEENFIEGNQNCISENINTVKNDLDNENMEKQLLDYMKENEDIYKDKTEIYLENKPGEKIKGSNQYSDYSAANFNSENMNLDNYYEKVVDITKEIKLPDQILDKQKELKDPQINLNTKTKENNQNSDITWEYKDENIMNGGEINGGLFGWDSSTYSQYASLEDNNTILPCSNN